MGQSSLSFAGVCSQAWAHLWDGGEHHSDEQPGAQLQPGLHGLQGHKGGLLAANGISMGHACLLCSLLLHCQDSQTFFSLWIFIRLCGFWLGGKYNWVCQPVDYSNSEDGLAAANIVWWYFASKFTDFMDSFFFVLRKKNNQLTSLHVIHHAMMPMTSWIFLKFVGGGHSTFFMFLNMGVRVVMYFYYLMSSMGPEVQKYLWWKRYITSMQLLQFVTFSIHGSLPLFMDCNYPKGAVFFILSW